MCYTEPMDKRASYYVSGKNPLIWIAVLLLVCSAGFRIAFFCEKGADTTTVWFQIVLPVFATLVYTAIIALDGREHFYRTALPVFLIALYLGQSVLASGMHFWFVILHWIVYIALSVLYRQITAGHFKQVPLLWLMLVGVSAYFVWETKAFYLGGATPLQYLMQIPNLMLSVGMLLACLAIRPHTDGKYHPTWGDRSDGRRLRSLEPMTMVAPFIMPDRNGASNLIRDSVEITEVERYIRQKRKEGLPGLGITEVFICAYLRCIAKFPACNRFLSGQRIYSRGEDVQFCMVVKKEMNKDAPDTTIKLHLNAHDTIEDVYRKFRTAVEEVQGNTDHSFFDVVAGVLASIPGVILKFVIWLLKTLDYFGLLPKVLLEVSPFHGSIFFTSMGSLGIPPVFHHLYDFGNLPVFCAFGCKHRVNEVQPDGTLAVKRYVDYTFVLDERTVDGFYYAETLRYFRRLLKDPSRLDEPVVVVPEVD